MDGWMDGWMVDGFTHHIFKHKSEIVDGVDDIMECHNIVVF